MSDSLPEKTSTDTYVERLRNIVNVAEGYLLDPHRDRPQRIRLALLALEKAWMCERCEGEGEVDDCDDCPEYKCEVAWTPPLPVNRP